MSIDVDVGGGAAMTPSSGVARTGGARYAPAPERAGFAPVAGLADAGPRHFRLSDGRQIAARIVGTVPAADKARDGSVVLALHGTPGSRLKFAGAEQAALALGMTLISIDRWGYGDSDPHPAPTLRAFADDMAEVLDALGLERVSVVGVSGGGPYAVALAAGLPDRVAALALAAPVGPLAEAGYVPRLRFAHRLCFEVLPRIPGGTAAVFALYQRLLAVAPSTAAGLISARASRRDREIVLMPHVRARLAATFSLGLARGSAGAEADLTLFARPWAVDLARVTAPSRVWLGTEDLNVPAEPITWLADAIGAEFVSLPGEGHYWIALHYREVLEWLAERRAHTTYAPSAAAAA